jgi:p-cumate 2,3-dioxygenase subunit beta
MGSKRYFPNTGNPIRARVTKTGFAVETAAPINASLQRCQPSVTGAGAHVLKPSGAAIMTTTTQASARGVTRHHVEDFLIAEADLLDTWRLHEWLALFDPEATGYYMPTTDLPDGDPGSDLMLIADDMTKLRSRVDQLLSGVTWAENPRSRTRRMISNVKIDAIDGDVLSIRANFVVYRMRFQNIDPYIGEYRYKLKANGGTFTILERRVVLDLEALRPHGKVSFIV